MNKIPRFVQVAFFLQQEITKTTAKYYSQLIAVGI